METQEWVFVIIVTVVVVMIPRVGEISNAVGGAIDRMLGRKPSE